MSALMKQETSTPREPFMAFLKDDITSRSMADIAGRRGWNETRIFAGGVDQAIENLQEISTPELLIIDLSNCDTPLDKIIELGSVCEEGVRLVCLGTTNDVTLYRELLEMGVDDYLLKPVDPMALEGAIERALVVVEEVVEEQQEAYGEVVSVVGALGGVGNSAIALNLAWDQAQKHKKRVALVDLDLHFGTIALSLDLEPGKGFREALENPNRIDSLFLDRAMIKVDERLSILSTETDIATACAVKRDAVELLIEKLRQKFDLVMIDLPRSLLPECGSLLASMGKTLVISDLSLTGLRDTLRITRFVKDLSKNSDLRVIVNKVGENKERELTDKEFEKGIEYEINASIPFDVKGFAAAEMQGATIMKAALRSKSGQALSELSAQLFDEVENTVEKQPFWSNFLKKK